MRNEILPLHPVVVDHLRELISEHPLVFRWCHDPRTVWVEFTRIQ